jgi:hypothetical protein
MLREMVSGHVRRFGGWTALRRAVASELGIALEEVLELAAAGSPVAYVDARAQHGQFQLRLEIFVDPSRAPRWRSPEALLAGLARALGEDVLFDDGGSRNPYRWVLVRPDGARFEVFEDASHGGQDLVLDDRLPPRRLADPS